MDIKFNNYCVIILEAESAPLEEIFRMADKEPKITEYNKFMVMATFDSSLTINELSEYLKTFDIEFILTIIDDNFSINIKDSDIKKHLFDNLRENYINDSPYNNIHNSFSNPFNKLGNEFSFDYINDVFTDIFENKYEDDVLDAETEINVLLDKMIDENYVLSENEKKYILKIINN